MANLTTLLAGYLGFKAGSNVQPTMQEPDFDPNKLGPKETYLTWQAQVRPEKKSFNKRIARTLLVIGVVISLLLAIMGEFMLILVMGSMMFISYVLSNTPPENITYEISNHGIRIDATIYYWHRFRHFFYKNVDGTEMFAIDTVKSIPGRIYLAFTPDNRDRIKEILTSKMTFLENEPTTIMDKAYNKVIDKFNFQN
jgi:hypothetical protein